MAFQPVWAVRDGLGTVEGARRNTNASTSGATGITRPNDLEVRALDVPGTAVQIMPGSGTIVNQYPGAVNESYSVANDAADGDAIVPVPATGSTGPATRYVVVRVDDPQFGGQVPADPATATFCRPVLLDSLANVPYPILPLARIDQPASTGTITSDLIHDLRTMAVARSWRRLLSYALFTADGDVLAATGADGEYWPSVVGRWDIPVPEWATRMNIKADWGSVRQPPGNVVGRLWVQIGDNNAEYKYSTQPVRYDTMGLSQAARVTYVAADDLAVKPEIRGTTVRFGMRGRVDDIISGGTAARVRLDWGSSVALDVEFLEAPEVQHAP